MEMTKFQATGAQVKGTIPFAKIDTEKRTVRGFATLDNIDLQGDVVTYDATRRAFATTTAKIREMHQPRVAGKIASFEPAEYFDPETNKTYRGMIIEAYISKGNQNAWEMVLDGSYSAFSIGGNITDSEEQFVKDGNGGRKVRFVKAFDLHEVSLVDNGANQFANFISIEKSDNGKDLVKGMVADTELNNVYYCETDKIVRALPDESAECLVCEKEMTNIGWIDGKETEAINKLIDNFVKTQEGGQTNMADEVNEEVNEVAEVEEQPVDETPEVVETEGVEVDLEKQVSELTDTLSKIDERFEEHASARDALAEELRKEISTKMEEHEKKQTEVVESLEDISKRLKEAVDRQEDIKKALDEVQGNLKKTATRDSAEVESNSGLEKSVTKSSIWDGRFFQE